MKTISLKEQMDFQTALKCMLDGKCLGIRPGNNSGYVEFFKPHWMNNNSSDYMLRWSGSGSEGDCTIRSNQYLEKWTLVIVDHRTIGEIK